mmetsp:Transcript_87376/g.187376  ORF Transcript_87376/g.187376 Transcript_87376/m.187376 type:complete len:323 (+) Transcript_87376:94-1062(+)
MADEREALRESLKEKGGVELFRELSRYLSTVVFEDYYKMGAWNIERLKLDIEILAAHRLEAGAPDIPPLEDIPMPAVPFVQKPQAIIQGQTGVLTGLLRPVGIVGATRPALMGVRPPVVRPVVALGGMTAPGAGGPVGVAAEGGAVEDLRSIALFVSKWGLEPVRTKELLSQMSLQRRRYVMQNFKDATTNGTSPVAKLEEYIAQCEKSNVWGADGGAVTVPPPGGATAPGAVGSAVLPAGAVGAGVKRSLEQDATPEGENKRAAVDPQGAVVVQPPSQLGQNAAVRPPGPLSVGPVRPVAPGAVLPPKVLVGEQSQDPVRC